jgi:hypothetical protein
MEPACEGLRLTKVFLEWFPIVRVPPPFQVIEVAFRKSFVLQYHQRSGPLWFKLKLNNRVNARVPMRGAPRLHDPLVWYQLDVSANDLSSEHGKGSARFRIDLCGRTRECFELFCIQKNLVDVLRVRLQVDLLMQRSACSIGGICRFLFHRLWRCPRKCTAVRSQAAKHHSNTRTCLPPRQRGQQRSRIRFSIHRVLLIFGRQCIGARSYVMFKIIFCWTREHTPRHTSAHENEENVCPIPVVIATR